MDIHVPAGTEAPQNEDVFSVVIQVGSNTPSLTTNIKLVHYERISTYASYDDCRDEGVDGDLCVCSSTPTLRDWFIKHPPVHFGYKSTVTNLNSNLHIYERRTSYGLVLEASNDSSDQTYEVLIRTISEVNVGHSNSYPLTLKIKPGNIIFIDIFYQLNPKHQWDYKYNVEIRQVK